MKEKIVFILILLIFSSLALLNLPAFAQSYDYTESESITCGNGICEVMEFQLKKGEETPVEIAGKTYNFKFLEIIQTKSGGKIISYRTVISVNGEEIGGEMGVEEIIEKYGFHFIATAKSEDIASVKIQETEVKGCKVPDCEFEVELNLYKGWNIVPLYFLREKTLEKGTCKPKDFLVVYGYDPIEKDYLKLHTFGKRFYDLEVSINEFEKIGKSERILVGIPFNSVWVYSINECKVVAEMPNFYRNLLLVLEHLKEGGTNFASGWNFWTGSKDVKGKSFDEIKGSCTIEKAYTFDASSQSWRALTTPPGPETNFLFKVKDACMFGEKATIIPEAPGLPEEQEIPEEGILEEVS